ncbi:MAG: hypothetical protein ABEJ83_05435 [Candidatus Nanohaloarchaea archaeon]
MNSGEQVWQPYRVWRKSAGRTSIGSGRVADHGAEFIEGLSDYSGVELEDVGGLDVAFAAMGDVEEV